MAHLESGNYTSSKRESNLKNVKFFDGTFDETFRA